MGIGWEIISIPSDGKFLFGKGCYPRNICLNHGSTFFISCWCVAVMNDLNQMTAGRSCGNVAIFLLVGILVGCGSEPAPKKSTSATETKDSKAGLAKSGENASGTTPPIPVFSFEEVTKSAGINFAYRNSNEKPGNYAILDSLGGGLSFIDFDKDGKLDLFINGGGTITNKGEENHPANAGDRSIIGYASKLYRNMGDWKFVDVSKETGIDKPLFYNHGSTVFDYDRDGWPDLVITGYGRLALMHNEPGPVPGTRVFVDKADLAGFNKNHFWSTSAGAGDFDGDGFPDLYLCQYVNWSLTNDPKCPGYTLNVERDVCPPKKYEAVPHAVWRNNGNGTFSDVSREAGLRLDRPDKEYGKGLGVVCVDVTNDGKADVYVANDTVDNFLYINKSTPGKIRFEEVGLEWGVARDDRGMPNGSMGVDAADYDGSGQASIWVTNYEGELHSLYGNVAQGTRRFFQFRTQRSGIAAIGQLHVGFGTLFSDFDLDGWEDIMVSNGHVIYHPVKAKIRQKAVLLHNLGNGKFQEAGSSSGSYFSGEHLGRGLVSGDLDNDGWPDLAICHANENASMLRNQSSNLGNKNTFLGIELVGKNNADIVGARVELSLGSRKLTRFAKGGGSYLSGSDRRLIFGLPDGAPAQSVTVYWPDGTSKKIDGLKAGAYHKIQQ